MQKTKAADRRVQLRHLLDAPETTARLAALMLRIRAKDGRLQALSANAAQRQYERHRGQHNIVLKARQMGMTTWLAGRFFLQTALSDGCTTLLVAHNQQASEQMFGIIRRMWEALPEDVREEEFRLRRLNAAEMCFAQNGSEFRVASAADLNAGRGLSVRYLHCSEVSRWPGDAKATLAGLRAALVPQGELVLESTPSGAHGAFYDEWQAATWPVDDAERATRVDGEIVAGQLVRHFFPWWMEGSYAGAAVPEAELTDEELALARRHGLSGAQIGFRRSLQKSFGPMRDQEFAEDAETCFRATGSCCFEIEAVEERMRTAPEPVRRMRNGALWEWLPPREGRAYLLAVDTAGGGEGGDYAAVQVLDLATGLQCAELQERLRPSALAAVCAGLADRYNRAVIAVERNNHGAAVLALLALYPGVELLQQDGQAGWLTTARSKAEMLACLTSVIQEAPELLCSSRLLRECRSFVLDERGRAGAASGSHDDLVMAMAMAHAVRTGRQRLAVGASEFSGAARAKFAAAPFACN